MSKLYLSLNYNEIRERIDDDKANYKPAEWAKFVGVSKNVVTNIHGKAKIIPSLQYIVAVAKATGKPIEWYLYGIKSGDSTYSVNESIKKYGKIYQQLYDDLDEIIKSGNKETIKAITQNLQEFRESVRKDNRDKEKDQKISALNDKVNKLITELNNMKKTFDEIKKPLPHAKIVTTLKSETSSD